MAFQILVTIWGFLLSSELVCGLEKRLSASLIPDDKCSEAFQRFLEEHKYVTFLAYFWQIYEPPKRE